MCEYRSLFRISFLFSVAAANGVRAVATKEKNKKQTISTRLVFLFTHLRRVCVVYEAKEKERERE